jgi:lipoate-protein ligase A
VSIGRHQLLERAIDLDYCRSCGIPWVRRPTGGRAVFHEAELTYAVVSNDPELTGNGVIDTYRRIAEALQLGLELVGVEAQSARAEREESVPLWGVVQKPCFASPSRYELLVERRKVAGSAQRRLRRAILQHGSVPIEIDYQQMGRVLGYSPTMLQERMISVVEAAGRRVDFPELADAVQQGFRTVFSRCFGGGRETRTLVRKGAGDDI